MIRRCFGDVFVQSSAPGTYPLDTTTTHFNLGYNFEPILKATTREVVVTRQYL